MVREPDVSVVGIVAPVAIVVEIVIADNIVREILRGTGVVVAMVSGVSPGVEGVWTPDLLDIGI
jgi:hypothetical protein